MALIKPELTGRDGGIKRGTERRKGKGERGRGVSKKTKKQTARQTERADQLVTFRLSA